MPLAGRHHLRDCTSHEEASTKSLVDDRAPDTDTETLLVLSKFWAVLKLAAALTLLLVASRPVKRSEIGTCQQDAKEKARYARMQGLQTGRRLLPPR